MANLAKTNTEVSFQKINALTLRLYFKKYAVSRVCQALFFFVAFNIIISYIFPEISLKLIKSLRRYEFLLPF